MIDRVGDEWVRLRVPGLIVAVSREHAWFRLFGRGMAAKRKNSWHALSERYAGQHGFPKIRWVGVGSWHVRWLGR